MIWHYTTGQKYNLIVQTGMLRVTAVNVPEGERPALWFSRREDFEPTARKGGATNPLTGEPQTLTVEQMSAYGGGLVRFGLPDSDPRLLSWGQFRRRSGIAPDMVHGLKKAAKRLGGHHSDWMATFDDIPVSDCLVEWRDAAGAWRSR